MLLRLVFAASLVVGSLSGCGFCTAVGCADALTIELGPAAPHFGLDEPVSTRVCVGSQCVTETLTQEANNTKSSGPALTLLGGKIFFNMTSQVSGAQTVTLQLTKNGTVVFDQSREGVTFTTSSPNGPGCAPLCQKATVNF